MLSFCLGGCQVGYYMHSAYHQTRLIISRQSVKKALASDKLTEEQKRKLRLIEEAKSFGENELGLAKSSNYTSFIQLDGPFVTYIVQAAYAYELKPYLWSFPFVGKVPYKGYFSKSLAEEEAAGFDHARFDTYVRGVSAYSTLGWFEDSVLSSMLRYQDHDLVELILHETIHTTLYIRNAAEFNERLATFMGHQGMQLFYLRKEGTGSPSLKMALDDTHDQALFSAFLTEEIKSLKTWYEANRDQISPEAKISRLNEIRFRFSHDLKPKLKTQNYDEFEKRELNNAFLLSHQTYMYSLEDFRRAFDHFGRDFKRTLAYFKSLEKNPDPAQTLRDFVSREVTGQ
jgi:predicted aminopeptidase